MEYDFPVSVHQWMEDGEVPLYGDGDGHEDAGAEEDVVEGVQEVGQQVVVDLGHQTTNGCGVSFVILKCSPHTLRDADDQEEEVANGEGDQQVVEVALESLLREDTDGEDVCQDAEHGQDDVAMALCNKQLIVRNQEDLRSLSEDPVSDDHLCKVPAGRRG